MSFTLLFSSFCLWIISSFTFFCLLNTLFPVHSLFSFLSIDHSLSRDHYNSSINDLFEQLIAGILSAERPSIKKFFITASREAMSERVSDRVCDHEHTRERMLEFECSRERSSKGSTEWEWTSNWGPAIYFFFSYSLLLSFFFTCSSFDRSLAGPCENVLAIDWPSLKFHRRR